ncbi:uncharacterized protein MAM_07967 [Metarhizium album ARSEF 1941]|uniref:NAD kinase associated with ferric reductase n=1 Tax=Metarhizium album (strain ARSEF 1941) TaxID=1081103 RepID=A0A0B2WKW2_METAS|nr:uncharacterized protein MAM_07967 [Metarhizium album ARSEF 1941]KHN94127.1 hypothetical protein MAM_07967 [Metarhizium album ARSEF 1941]
MKDGDGDADGDKGRRAKATPPRHATYAEAEKNADVSVGDSDDDTNALEVTFDPANPYRRKSSLVASEVVPPYAHRHPATTRRDQCLVHQFLDSQRRANAAVSDSGQKRYHAHPIYASPDEHDESPADGTRQEDKDDRLLGSKHKPRQGSRVEVDVSSLEGGRVGQADQEAWTRIMSKSASQLDLTQNEDVHSRMLTKKQLSDMAWGVRELSRRLSSMRIRFHVKTIFLLTKVYDQDLIPKTRDLTKWLLHKERDVDYVVYVQDKLKTNKKFDVAGILDDAAKSYPVDLATARASLERRLRYWDETMCRSRPHMFDFVITLGGDGTVLYASWLFQRIVPPVLSFALGSLGFLTKFDFGEHERILGSVFDKGVTVSLRLRFESTVMRSIRRKYPDDEKESGEDDDDLHRRRDLVEELIGEEREDEHTHRPDGTYEILNEVVVDRGPNPTMSYTEIFGDDEHFTSILADGVCVSTPTGSTAYNLAAGGSLCHPENPVMLVTSICAHTLSFRPIILPDTIVLRVGVPYDARTASWASFDGRERVEMKPGDYVTISASRFPFASVQTEGRRSEDWVNSIRGKLGWNTRQKQKEFKQWD